MDALLATRLGATLGSRADVVRDFATASSRCDVEDSASGVGSAANAGCGLIVGYVGATHIPAERKDSHAKMLMEGKRADDGRGAEVVISEFQDLLPIVAHFNACYQASEAAAGFLPLPESLTQSFKGPFWVRS